MKKVIFYFLLASLLGSSSMMQAQNIEYLKYYCLRINGKKGKNVKINFKGSDKVWIVKGDHTHIEKINLGPTIRWGQAKDYTMEGSQPWIKIYAKNLHGISIDAYSSSPIEVDFSKIPEKLNNIAVTGAISACAYDAMYHTLPVRERSLHPIFLVSPKTLLNNTAKKSTTSIATDKGWGVLYSYGGAIQKPEPVNGDGTGCPKSYNLYINSVRVTNLNCSNLSKIDGVRGTVRYNPLSKTLTLDSAVIKANSSKTPISIQSEGLKIELTGINNVAGKTASALYTTGNMEITGGGTMNASNNAGTTGAGISIQQGKTVTIRKCTVNASGKYGIKGNGGKSALVIDSATVTAVGRDNNPSFFQIKSMDLKGCIIKTPVGAKFDAGKATVVDAGNNPVKTKVVIKPDLDYGFQIAGVQVTPSNYNSLSTIPGVSGTIKYKHATRTLTLDNAKIESSSPHCIWNTGSNGLKIVLKGTNELKRSSGAFSALFTMENLTITGNGTLNATHTTGEGSGIAINKDKTLTISNCTVNASGKHGFCTFPSDAPGTLVIDHATVKATGKDNPSFAGIKTLTLQSCDITSPMGARFDATQNTVVDADGNPLKTEVVIEPVVEYGLQIAGVQVTDKNYYKLLEIPGVSGTIVQYNHNSQTLTLDNARIESSANCIRNNSVKGLKIELIGTNELKSTNDRASLISNKNLTINGGGTLNATTENGWGIGLPLNDTLTIRNCTVNVSGKTGGIAAHNTHPGILAIDNATVKATGNDGPSLMMRFLILTGCAITSPAGAVFDATKRAVVDASGNRIKGEVVIEPITPVSGVALNETEIELAVDSTFALLATVSPDTATNKSVSWNSDNEAVATVDSISGLVTAVAEGTAHIIVTTNEGNFTDTCTVTVKKSTGIQDLNASEVNLYPNPANGQFFVEVPASGKLEITNLAGQKVQEFALKTGKNEVHIKQPGMYFIYLTGKEYRTVKKLIVK